MRRPQAQDFISKAEFGRRTGKMASKSKFDQIRGLLADMEQQIGKTLKQMDEDGAVPLFDVSKIESMGRRLGAFFEVKKEVGN